MKTMGLKLLAASALSMAAVAPAAAADLIVSGTMLTGAKNVLIAGANYDVAFVDGTCAEVFGTCTSADFTFTTTTTAVAAMQALLDQVFINTASGAFDDTPSLTQGCTDALSCNILTPFSANAASPYLTAAAASNYNAVYSSADAVRPVSHGVTSSTTTLSNVVYAKFTPVAAVVVPVAVAGVPEPATWGMMILGFGMIGGTMRRRRMTIAYA